MQLLLGLWVASFIAYAAVVLLRWNLRRREDDHLHFADSEQGLVAAQSSVAHKLDVVDRWRTGLLILIVLLALIIVALRAYMAWQTNTLQ